MTPTDKIEQILTKLLHRVRMQDYRGYNKHDGLLSPILGTLFGNSRIGRLIAIQSVMRMPVNVRPLLGIPRTRNPKGIALFARSLLRTARIFSDPSWEEAARELLDWLLVHSSNDYEGTSWGYQYPWQDVGFYAPAHTPNRIVTGWVTSAFLEAWEQLHDPRYLHACRGAARFLLSAPERIVDNEQELCLSYAPVRGMSWAVMDVSALAAHVLSKTAMHTGESALLSDARRCMRYVAERQTDYGAWFYTDPPAASHIVHDNYHTGIILDSIAEYMDCSGDREYERVYERGLEYYAENLFLPGGAPKWMNDKRFPHDVHGAAQGILTFSRAGSRYPKYRLLSTRILEWTLQHLYNEKSGEFRYRAGRIPGYRYTLMRWCNGWMSLALAEYLLTSNRRRVPGESPSA